MNKTKNIYKNNLSNTWDSELIETPLDIIVPLDLQKVLISIQESNENNEFTILVKGQWADDGFRLSNEYYIPRQKVTGASVDYLENLRPLREEQGYNVLIHSHPFSSNTSYSSSDEETANTHFDAALLFNGDQELTCGIVKINLENHRIIKLDMNIHLEYTLPEINIDNIEKTNVHQRYNYGILHTPLKENNDKRTLDEKLDEIDDDISSDKGSEKAQKIINQHYGY